ncbi:MlaD family protein [Nocardia sp. NBC_00511]|uniref:MlaD family protein n=1 Tax=Nocardia sp. NBC_00511 TaxID=2903591 RepID=UPI0030E1ACC5
MRWGIAGMIGVIIVLAACGLVYVLDGRATTYTAQLPDAGAVRAGDDVRVAGMTVGAVKSLSLLADRVEMTFTVDREVFVGAQSSLDIRMLTVVGGHYVALHPAGTQSLGTAAIPVTRVVLPYNLPTLFQDAITPLQAIDGNTVRRNVDAIAASVEDSPASLRELVTAAGDVVDILNAQNADISRTLAVADDYLTALNTSKSVVWRLLTSLNLLETIIADHNAEVGLTLRTLADVLSRIAPLGRAWDPTLQPMAQGLADAIPKLDDIGAKLSALLGSVKALGTALQPLTTEPGGMTIDQSSITISTAGLCVPVPGRDC